MLGESREMQDFKRRTVAETIQHAPHVVTLLKATVLEGMREAGFECTQEQLGILQDGSFVLNIQINAVKAVDLETAFNFVRPKVNEAIVSQLATMEYKAAAKEAAERVPQLLRDAADKLDDILKRHKSPTLQVKE